MLLVKSRYSSWPARATLREILLVPDFYVAAATVLNRWVVSRWRLFLKPEAEIYNVRNSMGRIAGCLSELQLLFSLHRNLQVGAHSDGGSVET